MEASWFIFLALCTTIVSSFDLGQVVRIAQCRSLCLKFHSHDGSCDWYTSRSETTCSECWRNCANLETHWEGTKNICEGIGYENCPACQTACRFRNTRVEEVFLPSSLPAPKKGPIKLGEHDMAIRLHKVNGGWKEGGYFPGSQVPELAQDTWIIAIVDDGVQHYSFDEWVPTLETLKEGPLVEATLSWRDIQIQLTQQRAIENKRLTEDVHRFYLEKYGKRVLFEWTEAQKSTIPKEVFTKFFFSNEKKDDPSEDENAQYDGVFEKDPYGQESYVVSWEPEAGGLMGNQVVDSTYAQISLLPGMKYQVRIATNDGPGSFPIEIDTRSVAVTFWRIKQQIVLFHPWAIMLGGACGSMVIALSILFRVRCKRKTVIDSDEEEV